MTHTTSPNNGDTERALPKLFGVSRDAESPGGKAVLVTFHRALTDDELRVLHDALADISVKLSAEYMRGYDDGHIAGREKGKVAARRSPVADAAGELLKLMKEIADLENAFDAGRDYTNGDMLARLREIADLRTQLAQRFTVEQVQAMIALDRAQLARTSAPEGAPVGMVLVPVEPTLFMVGAGARAQLNADAGQQANSLKMARVAYAAMIAAAPTSASAQPAEQPAPCRNCVGQGWEPGISGERRPCAFCQPASILHDHSEGGHHD